MRKFAQITGSIGMGFALVLLGVPVSRADDVSFVEQAHALGFQQWDDVLIRMGLSACRFLQPNLRRHSFDVADHIRRSADVQPDQANQFLTLSVNEYCPDLAYRIGE
jgi:hypothetical protein